MTYNGTINSVDLFNYTASCVANHSQFGTLMFSGRASYHPYSPKLCLNYRNVSRIQYVEIGATHAKCVALCENLRNKKTVWPNNTHRFTLSKHVFVNEKSESRTIINTFTHSGVSRFFPGGKVIKKFFYVI